MNLEQPSIRRYAFLFVAYYLLCVTLVAVFLAITGLDLGHSLELSIVLSASLGISSRFVKENSRAPTVKERRRLSLICMFIAVGLSLLLTWFSVSFFSDTGKAGEIILAFMEMPFSMWLLALVFSMGLSYLILNVSLGWFARKTEASWRAKGKLA